MTSIFPPPAPAPTVADTIADLNLPHLVHFTPTKTFFHIAADGQITPNKQLSELAPDYFDPTDELRLDRHPEMSCVTFSYPNPFYFAKARANAKFKSFPDWVCLLIKVDVLTRDGVLFSPGNAAKGGGAYLKPGAEGLARCFAQTTATGYSRMPNHHPLAATDLQAEALIPGPIPVSDITAIVLPTAAAPANAQAQLRAGGQDPNQFNWVVSEKMFQREALKVALHNNKPVEMEAWSAEQEGES